jgi:hypothetical protein
MTTATVPIPVEGTIQSSGGRRLLILTARLEGHDTFLTGSLHVGSEKIAVRVMTFDDMTVLLPDPSAPQLPDTAWAGILQLRTGRRDLDMPPDLASAAQQQGVLLSALDEPEMRYATTYLGEASTAAIRQARIAAILAPLPRRPGACS